MDARAQFAEGLLCHQSTEETTRNEANAKVGGWGSFQHRLGQLDAHSCSTPGVCNLSREVLGIRSLRFELDLGVLDASVGPANRELLQADKVMLDFHFQTR